MRNVALRVAACFDRRLTRGVWQATLTIVNSGQATNVQVQGPSPGTPTDQCIVAAVSTAKFPPFIGAPITITWPYVLR